MIYRKVITLMRQSVVVRHMAALPSQKEQMLPFLKDAVARDDEEWRNAKDYADMPGPSGLGLLMDFLPGGKLHNANMIELHAILHESHGNIFRLKGTFGKLDVVCTHNPKDFEIAFRNEGLWPLRIGLDTFAYYRLMKRPEVYHGCGGLITEQGKTWADIRNKMNPILMKVQNVRQNLPVVNEIADDFMTKFKQLYDPLTHRLSSNFQQVLQLFTFEVVGMIALNTRMGMLSDKPDPDAPTLVRNMNDFFQLSYEFDVVPSFWKYIETPRFKRLMRTYDSCTDITTNYIEQAMRKFDDSVAAKSVLEKVCRIDKKVAVIMAIDMLMAGIDTTASTFITVLYALAKNPEKQALLLEELRTLMPSGDTPLTEENTKNMPYMRACLKEALRMTPITPNNFRVSVKELVLSGYKVPAGTGILMNSMATSNREEHFPRSKEFLPERWLKSGPNACPAAKHKNPFVYMPFGFGPRTCIGKRIAELEIEVLLAKLLRNYHVTWDSAQPLKYTSNIILVPSGEMSFKFEPIQDA